ncbi:TRAP transporter substrate-binding protein [Acuticoccus yangtzensis]|uniref:TRAP transporter substrate-binding protein n=1 Tax=Acuticoccus yangtzensis TaxID=1443441 RepID=UPI000949A55A|nr:TRAP transporter substrate-binding protein [Acuticoccus yangtzensis]ORE91483.1 TRAP dicarboxylate transporter subunit DctP [Stappia sp. 22II-S9-Z10]
MKKLLLAGAAAGLMMAASAPASATDVMKLGHVGEPGSLYHVTSDEFAKCMLEKADVEVQLFGSSQLGNDESMLQKLKLGQLDFSIPSSIMSSVSDTFGVFEMPYIVKSRDHMRAIRDQAGDMFRDAAREEGYEIISFWENGFRNVTNNVRPVTVPEDLKGIKLRTPKGQWRVKMFQAYGANPTPMAFSEVFTALKTGVIDGQENPLIQIFAGKFQEVQKYLSMTGHVYSPAYLATSSRNWNKWDDDRKAAISECALQASDFAYEHGAQVDSEFVAKFEEAGVEVNEANKQAFIDASADIYKEFGEEVEGGADLISKIQSLDSGAS